jgi:hypothetical protein
MSRHSILLFLLLLSVSVSALARVDESSNKLLLKTLKENGRSESKSVVVFFIKPGVNCINCMIALQDFVKSLQSEKDQAFVVLVGDRLAEAKAAMKNFATEAGIIYIADDGTLFDACFDGGMNRTDLAWFCHNPDSGLIDKGRTTVYNPEFSEISRRVKFLFGASAHLPLHSLRILPEPDDILFTAPMFGGLIGEESVVIHDKRSNLLALYKMDSLTFKRSLQVSKEAILKAFNVGESFYHDADAGLSEDKIALSSVISSSDGTLTLTPEVTIQSIETSGTDTVVNVYPAAFLAKYDANTMDLVSMERLPDQIRNNINASPVSLKNKLFIPTRYCTDTTEEGKYDCGTLSAVVVMDERSRDVRVAQFLDSVDCRCGLDGNLGQAKIAAVGENVFSIQLMSPRLSNISSGSFTLFDTTLYQSPEQQLRASGFCKGDGKMKVSQIMKNVPLVFPISIFSCGHGTLAVLFTDTRPESSPTEVKTQRFFIQYYSAKDLRYLGSNKLQIPLKEGVWNDFSLINKPSQSGYPKLMALLKRKDAIVVATWIVVPPEG